MRRRLARPALLSLVLLSACQDSSTSITAIRSDATIAVRPSVYNAMDLGALPPSAADSSQGFAINDKGFVAGFSETAGTLHPALWTPQGSVIDLGVLGGDQYGFAQAVNKQNDAVGFTGQFLVGEAHAALWPYRGSIVALGTLPGGSASYAMAISDAGIVAGFARDAAGANRAVRWVGTTIADLGTLPGDVEAQVGGINSAGDIVGCSMIPFVLTRAAKWPASGGVVALAMPIGKTYACATSINTAGEIVGYSMGPLSNDPDATKWLPNGTVLILPKPAAAFGAYAFHINDNGEAVGVGGGRALLWDASGAVHDLGTLPGGSNSWAFGINDHGDIAGFSDGAGIPHMHATCWSLRKHC